MASGSRSTPRELFLSDHDYFMALALLTSQRSTNPDKQVGACIVKQEDKKGKKEDKKGKKEEKKGKEEDKKGKKEDKKVIAVGYNKVLNNVEGKYPCECHAEVDAIMNCADVKGCTMFVTMFPCNECIKLIVQAGIQRVVWLSDNPDAEPLEKQAADKMVKEELMCEKYKPERNITMPPQTKKPRLNSLAESDYFMAVALLTAKRSRDPSTQVGACAVKDSKVIAVGHNQMPNGNDDGVKYTWSRNEGRDNKYLYVCHAELNTIVNRTDLKDCTVYVTLFPCSKCASLLVRADVKTVIYLTDKYAHLDDTKESKKILKHIKHEIHTSAEETLEMYLENIYHILFNRETNQMNLQ